MNINYEQQDKWDNFIYQLMIGIKTAQDKYKYFFLQDLNPKDSYDLFFIRASLIVSHFTKCNIRYAPHPNLFTFIRLKIKEPELKICLHKSLMRQAHICTKAERKELIDFLIEKCEITSEDIPLIYKEYYSK